MDALRQDLSFTLRSLRRTPGFTAAVLGTLAIGIGALTAVFSIVRSVLIKPLPYHAPEQIVQIWSGSGAKPHGPTSSANYVDLRDQARSFQSISAEDFAWFNVTSDDARPERLYGALVDPTFFSAIGVQPTLGRAFTSDDEAAGARVAVISQGVWLDRFGGDRQAVGRDVRLNREIYRIIGVMPAGFDFPAALIGNRVDVWVPLAWKPADIQRGLRRLGITARLVSGTSLLRAQREANDIAERLAAEYPQDNKGVTIRLVPLQEELVGSSERLLLVLLGAVGLVLLIACANVANLTLARAQSRQKEIHLRAALGAGRSRLVRQLLTESVLLALVGGSLGILIAVWATAAIVAIGPEGLPRVQEISVDGPVLAFALAVSTLSAVLFGLVPAFHVVRDRLGDVLAVAGRATATRQRRRGRNLVVVVELALALVLLVGAGLLLRSLERLVSVDPGFDPRSVLTASVVLPASKYANKEQQALYADASLARIASLPGVRSAGAVNYLPFSRSDVYLSITIDGRSISPNQDGPAAHIRAASSGYFATMHIPVAAGRAFTSTDRTGSGPVAIVNTALVNAYWPGEEPRAVIGRRIRIGSAESTSEWRTIVGAVGNVKHWNLGDAAEPELYVPLAQAPQRQLNIVVRAERSPGTLTSSVRQVLLAIDKDQPVGIRLLGDLVSESAATPRFRGYLLGAFAAIALGLALVGIYAVISYSVTQRTREVGVRVALGARRVEIVGLILREGATLTLAGIALGLAASFWLTRAIQGMLFHVGARDVATFVGVSVLLVMTATLANYLPARRASRVDPMIAMRAE